SKARPVCRLPRTASLELPCAALRRRERGSFLRSSDLFLEGCDHRPQQLDFERFPGELGISLWGVKLVHPASGLSLLAQPLVGERQENPRDVLQRVLSLIRTLAKGCDGFRIPALATQHRAPGSEPVQGRVRELIRRGGR